MEGLLLIAAYLKSQSLMEIATDMRPFLNIYEENILYYRIVILLKAFFAILSMKELFSKKAIFFLLVAGKVYLYLMNSSASLPLSILSLPLLIYIMPFNGSNPVFPIGSIFFLAVNIKPYEFLLDMYVLISVAVYVIEAYISEIQKLSTLILFILSLTWCMCSDTNDYGMSTYLILAALIFVYYPLLPEKRKFRHRLLYIYALVFAWILYNVYETCHYVQNTNNAETVVNISHNINACVIENETLPILDNEDVSAEYVYKDPDYTKILAQ